MQDLVAGQIDMFCAEASQTLPFLRSVGYGGLGDVAAGMAGALFGAWLLAAMGAPPDVGLLVALLFAWGGAAAAVLVLGLAIARFNAYWRGDPAY